MLREKGINSVFFNGQGFDNVTFPFIVDMEASHEGVPYTFKFVIYEPGTWEVVMYFN